MTLDAVLLWSSAPLWLYIIALNVRDVLEPRVRWIVNATQGGELFTGRAPTGIMRIANKRIKRGQKMKDTPLTDKERDRINRSTRRTLKTFILMDNVAKYLSPVIVVAMPIKIAVQLRLTDNSPWMVFVSITDIAWMVIAWYEIKKNGPWWRRKRDRLMEKVKQTVDGRLTVVPVGGSA